MTEDEIKRLIKRDMGVSYAHIDFLKKSALRP